MATIVAMALLLFSWFAQTPAAKRLAFEVASVKSAPPPTGFPPSGGPQGTRFTMTAVTLRRLLLYAYDLPSGPTDDRILGGPRWLDSDRFDIQAKAADEIGTLLVADARLMLQSLLEDRFKLKAHLEARDVAVYNLVIGKDGLKLKLSVDQGPYTGPGAADRALPTDALGSVPRGVVRMTRDAGGRTLTGSSVRLASLVTFLQSEVGRPVIDKTNAPGLYDFAIHLGAAPAPSPDAAAPGQTPTAAEPAGSIFKAFEDVGLRLEAARGSIKVLAVESVQKPSEN